MVTYEFSFEKLEVWQLARKLASSIYRDTAKFPPEEKYLLVSQMRKASVSVASNLAEGSGRTKPKDKAYFTTVAFSSLMELFNQLVFSVDLGYLSDTVLANYRTDIQKLSVKLSNLKQSQLKKLSKIQFLFFSIFLPSITRELLPIT